MLRLFYHRTVVVISASACKLWLFSAVLSRHASCGVAREFILPGPVNTTESQPNLREAGVDVAEGKARERRWKELMRDLGVISLAWRSTE